MKFSYQPKGVCSKEIVFELDDEKRIQSVQFTNGCHGNLQGIAALVKGMKAKEAIERLKGIRCGARPTSCPDQFATALEEALQNLALQV